MIQARREGMNELQAEKSVIYKIMKNVIYAAHEDLLRRILRIRKMGECHHNSCVEPDICIE